MAERVGFEPTIRFPVYTLSKRAPSATRPSLRRRIGKWNWRTFGDLAIVGVFRDAYQCARMRYFSTEDPFAATGTLNCAAQAAVLVYL